MKRTSKQPNVASPDEDSKQRGYLEMNKKAARKCREKKMKLMSQMPDGKDDISPDQRYLHNAQSSSIPQSRPFPMNADGSLRIAPCLHHPTFLANLSTHGSGAERKWNELEALGSGKVRLLSRYTPLNVIGRGAQGILLCAYDTLTQQRVVIKKMVDPFRNQFTARYMYREFTLLSSIQHPNIIRLLDAYTTGKSAADFNDFYLVMEHMDTSLQQAILRPDIERNHSQISFLFYQLLCAVHHMHRAGIVHRDVKPENIVINELSGELKLLDFGLARRMPTATTPNVSVDSDEEGRMTPYVVTRYYRAPEVLLWSGHQQAHGTICYSEKVDVWSVGVILLELVLNVCPNFVGRDMVEQWLEIVRLLGSPDQEFVSRLPDLIRHAISVYPRYPPINWSVTLRDSELPPDETEGLTGHNLRDLVSKILVIDPARRISTVEALNHPYVMKWFHDGDAAGKVPPRTPPPTILGSLDNDDSVQKSVAEWKALLFQKLVGTSSKGAN